MNTNVHARRLAIFNFRHVALSVAVAFFACLQVRPASADSGDGFAGFYQIVSMTPVDDETTTVTIRLRVQNVGGRTVDNAVMWLLDDAPGATIGWFHGSLVLGGRATPMWGLLDGNGVSLQEVATFQSLTSKPVSCSSGLPTDAIEETMAQGSSGIRFDTSSDQFICNLVTASGWKNQCRVLVLELAGGQEQLASFKLK